jgi:hypothetical protein
VGADAEPVDGARQLSGAIVVDGQVIPASASAT